MTIVKETTIVNKIIKLLEGRELNTVEIATKLGIDKSNCSVYLYTLKEEGRIVKVSPDGRVPIIYTSFPCMYLLRQLYNIMNTKMKPKEKLTDDEKECITKISEVLKDE